MNNDKDVNLVPPKRLMSLDALRGFDMFWIIGGDQLLRAFTKSSKWEWDDQIGEHMYHSAWEGVHAYDLIFPLFMFLAGVSIPYAITSKLEKGAQKKVLLGKVVKRVLILILLGLVYNGCMSFNFESLRAASVLAQIGVAYGIAAVICIFSKRLLTPLYWSLGIMLGYAILQLCLPVPNVGAGVLTKAGSVNSYVDSYFLPGVLLGKEFDPEGLMSMLSASAIVLMGYMAGVVLRSPKYTDIKKCVILTSSALVLIVLGLMISPYYPPIKQIWTTTFNLYAGGISLLLLVGFYVVVDMLQYQKMAFFFCVIGMNSISIYLAHRFIDFEYFSGRIFVGSSSIATVLLLQWLLLWLLYKKKLFLRV